jgi:hypothetical protein|tara:strand:- start:266 stop:835 length:570 start_codon:yes stop_codon:yes gene_type:complete
MTKTKSKKVSLQKKQKYKIDYLTKLSNKPTSHPVFEELRVTLGKKGTLERMVVKRQDRIESAELEIRQMNLELNKIKRELLKLQKKLEINPVIMFNQGRGKKYVVGKVWWFKRGGFGIKKGKKSDTEQKYNITGRMKYYTYHLGKMEESEEEWCKNQFGSDWKECILTEDDWKDVCRGKFVTDILKIKV